MSLDTEVPSAATQYDEWIGTAAADGGMHTRYLYEKLGISRDDWWIVCVEAFIPEAILPDESPIAVEVWAIDLEEYPDAKSVGGAQALEERLGCIPVTRFEVEDLKLADLRRIFKRSTMQVRWGELQFATLWETAQAGD